MKWFKYLILSLLFVVFGQNLSNAQPLLSGYFVSQVSCTIDNYTFIDDDACLAANAIEITDATIAEALDSLVLRFKGFGTTNGTDVWSKCYAIYPMSPTDISTITSASTKWNIKDPRDLDAAFRITWTNTPLFSVLLGVGQNGSSNAYGNTHFVESANMTAGNNGATFSTNGDLTSGDYIFGGSTEFAARTVFTLVTSVELRSANIILRDGLENSGGVYTQSRRSATDFEGYFNGASQTTDITSSTVQSTLNQFLLAVNTGSAVAHYQGYIKFFVFHDGLTDNESQDIYDAIAAWNTSLGR